MTSLEYYIEQVKQFISMLTDDIKSGYGTVVTQTKLAVYREVLKHLEEIEQEPSYNSIKIELNGDTISRQAVLDTEYQIKEINGIEYVMLSEVQMKIRKMPSVTSQPKTGHCKDCKWWKDSDGLYRRGVHAESKCPINRKEVYDGNGYCYMFEPKERSGEEC